MNRDLESLVRKQNLAAIDAWRRDHPNEQLDLSEANLSGLNLLGVNLSHANLTRANLENTDLSSSDLTHAILVEANLSTWDPPGTNLSYANLTNACLRGANLFRTNLSHANLREADLSEANLCRADLTEATLIGTRVYGISVWDVRLDGAVQQDLIVSQHGTSPRVDKIQFAQLINLLLEPRNVSGFIDTLGRKAVLILGSFSEERKPVLDAIAKRLREKDYLPLIFDFERARDKDFTEIVKVLAGLSFFIVADITKPRSIPLELQATVPDYCVPFVPILQSGEEPISLFVDLQNKYSWVLEVRRYASKERLIEQLDDAIIAPARKMHSKLVEAKARAVRIIELS